LLWQLVEVCSSKQNEIGAPWTIDKPQPTFFLISNQGKSLCYQLPAVVLGGTTIVISPLIALMVDQVKALNEKGVKAALISSGNGEKANREIMEQLLGRSQSNGKVKKQPTINEQEHEHITLLYVTPEQVQNARFRDALGELHKKNQLTLFAVDEAHWYVVL
jgi:superfamily II DNA helicase RecQ